MKPEHPLNFLFTLNEQGEPVRASSVVEWGKWYEDFAHRQLAKDQVEDRLISTVFLGIATNWGGKPLLFETMVFDQDGKPVEQQRYATRDEALRGHRDVVSRLRKTH